MQAIRQYVNIENGYLHVKLPQNFAETKVEIIILAIDKSSRMMDKISQEEALMQLAGTWTIQESDEFNQATDFFNQIDEELWK
jgi:hypothetical protein